MHSSLVNIPHCNNLQYDKSGVYGIHHLLPAVVTAGGGGGREGDQGWGKEVLCVSTALFKQQRLDLCMCM